MSRNADTTPTPRRAAVLALWVVLAVVAGGCTTAEPRAAGATPPPTPTITPLPPPVTAVPTDVLADSAARFVRTADGVALPDRALTPGDVYPDVTEADVCDDHFTQGVRQPRFNAKVAAFAAYGVSIHDRDVYQVDKLVPVSLGGSNEIENLWPQPYDGPAGAREKDLLERQLRGLVCSGALSLADAQSAIATDWWSAYGRYMGLPVPAEALGPEPWSPPTPTPGEVANQAPCTVEGAVGYTAGKGIRFTCERRGDGTLRWSKRD